jgi:hypothetical protein
MRLASLAFFLILFGLHMTSLSSSVLDQPLSMFRDGPHPLWGFAMFGLLTFIGLSWLWTLIRTRSISELIAVAPALPLLGYVALTDSRDAWHILASFVLLGWLLLFFAAKLWEEESWLLYPHLFMPIVIALTVQFHSFGLWQKTLIAYFVLAINMHDLVRRCEHETKPLPRPGRTPVSELAREFYERGQQNPLRNVELQRSNPLDCDPS